MAYGPGYGPWHMAQSLIACQPDGPLHPTCDEIGSDQIAVVVIVAAMVGVVMMVVI